MRRSCEREFTFLGYSTLYVKVHKSLILKFDDLEQMRY